MSLASRLSLLLSFAPALKAAPPANDQFSSRTSLSGSPLTVTATNSEATEEAGENLQGGLFGATVWWTWTAPADGWVKVDTEESDFDTVLQISTGATVAGQTIVAFNDQGPARFTPDASSISFWAAAGTAYNIAVGGWDFLGPTTGVIKLHLATGTAATPAFYPVDLAFTPGTANVTAAEVPVTATFRVVSANTATHGQAGIGFGWERNGGFGDYASDPVFWVGSTPNFVLQQQFVAPRYSAPGLKGAWLKIVSVSGTALTFSSPSGGSGYALPGSGQQGINILNDGEVDEYPPVLTAFSLSPTSVDVTTAAATLQISATATDSVAGVESVDVILNSPEAMLHLTAHPALNSGNAKNGTWTGSLTIPKGFPSGNYDVLVRVKDVAHNDDSWGSRGTTEIPGGDVTVGVVGGSSYEIWAYSLWFAPGDANSGLMEDADSDGKPNLLCYAFDLNPKNIRSSTGSLPLVEMTGTGAARKLRITYIRRKATSGSGLAYQPQFSSSPNGVWETVSGGTATSISTEWERVTVEDSVAVSAERSRYGRVRVEYTPP